LSVRRFKICEPYLSLTIKYHLQTCIYTYMGMQSYKYYCCYFSYNSLFVMDLIEQNFIFNGKIGEFPYIVCNYTLELNLLQISHRYTIKNTFNFDYRYENVHLYICLQLEFLYILQSAVKWYEWKLIINIWHSIRIVKKIQTSWILLVKSVWMWINMFVFI